MSVPHVEFLSDRSTALWPVERSPELWVPLVLTSADALLLSRQDPWGVDHTDALEDLVGHLGADEPAHTGERRRQRFTYEYSINSKTPRNTHIINTFS